MDKENNILMDDVDERIESFLRGTMSTEEESDFKREIKHNPELRARAMTLALLLKETQAEVAERDKEVVHSVKMNNPSKARSVVWWACSIAAVFAIFFSIYKDRRYSMLDATLSPYYSEYEEAEIIRGETDPDAVTHLYSLFNQIPKSRNVSSIIKELEPIYSSLNVDYTFYPFANDISWNLALAYIKNDQIDKAMTILEKLKSDNPDTPLFIKADELLNKLKKM